MSLRHGDTAPDGQRQIQADSQREREKREREIAGAADATWEVCGIAYRVRHVSV